MPPECSAGLSTCRNFSFMGVLNNLAIAILGLAVTSSHREVPDYCRVIDEAMTAAAREAMGVGLNVLTTAPPRHDQLREIVAPPFMPRALEAIEQRAAVLISAIFDRLGNRDEAAFQRPYAFDVTRHPNPHVGFGAGPHFCVGGPLAYIEVRLAMEQLLARYDGIEVTGPVERVQSSFLGGLKHLPVKLIARAAFSP